MSHELKRLEFETSSANWLEANIIVICLLFFAQDYISRCGTAIGKFESLVNQIQKNAKDIESRIQLIKGANLFKIIPARVGGDLPGVKVSRRKAFLGLCKK